VLTRLGRFCFHHRRLVLAGWLVAFVAGLAVGVQVFPRLQTNYSGSSIESFQGLDLMTQSQQYGSRISALVEGIEGIDRTTLRDDLTTAASSSWASRSPRRSPSTRPSYAACWCPRR